MLLVALAVALALVIALGLGVVIRERPRLARLVLGAASAVQTIPSLAIFGLLLTVPLLGGIGPTPAVVALTLYALLPLLRGLITGLRQVSPGLLEAGRALGLRSLLPPSWGCCSWPCRCCRAAGAPPCARPPPKTPW